MTYFIAIVAIAQFLMSVNSMTGERLLGDIYLLAAPAAQEKEKRQIDVWACFALEFLRFTFC